MQKGIKMELTVGQLIEKLQQFDSSKIVWIDPLGGMYQHSITSVKQDGEIVFINCQEKD